jgi:hypothetical protein
MYAGISMIANYEYEMKCGNYNWIYEIMGKTNFQIEIARGIYRGFLEWFFEELFWDKLRLFEDSSRFNKFF